MNFYSEIFQEADAGDQFELMVQPLDAERQQAVFIAKLKIDIANDIAAKTSVRRYPNISIQSYNASRISNGRKV